MPNRLLIACILFSFAAFSEAETCECGVFSYPKPVINSEEERGFKGFKRRRCLKGGSDLVSIAASEPECRKLCEEEADCEGYEVSGEFCRTVRSTVLLHACESLRSYGRVAIQVL
eukprot:TRINITY_DN15489_c0_g1_i1.p1 TRINITY_DN15489_c0_g1~~TRINITY_DN15489_c0_g1_i1.p1  ORF type:complete len:115 (+),score=7.86 TRINITY_DN15489_c0_g1_i1:44-388(+)